MSETSGTEKVPGRTASKPVEDKAADAVKEAADTAASEAKGFRARVRAIRNDYDVESIEKDAKPFLTGAVIVGVSVLDPVLGATVAVNRVGRYLERRHNKPKTTEHTDA